MILHEKTIKCRPSSDTGVKRVFFFYFVDCVVVWFCFNSSVNFAKHFCWLVIRLGSKEGRGRGGGASDPIKYVKTINKGCETNRKKIAETEKKSVNLDRNYQAPKGTESTDNLS